MTNELKALQDSLRDYLGAYGVSSIVSPETITDWFMHHDRETFMYKTAINMVTVFLPQEAFERIENVNGFLDVLMKLFKEVNKEIYEEIGSLNIGSPTSVKIRAEDGFPEVARCKFCSASSNPEGSEYPEWDIQWSIWAGPDYYFQKEDDLYVGEILILGVMGDDTRYKVEASVDGPDGFFPAAQPI